MITFLNLLKPLPSNLELQMPSCETKKYFDYKKYVNMDMMYSNLLKDENSILIDPLTIFSDSHYKYIDILYYNLQKVNTEYMCLNKRIDGSFNMNIDETSRLRYSNSNAIYHELVHMASTYYDKHNNILFNGFNYYDLTKKINIGEGLSEGYVQLITDRDTNNGNMLYKKDLVDKKIIFPIIYCYPNVLANQLEILIGKEKLEELFFKANFDGLMNELLKYSDKKSILKFFKNCDIASIHNYQFFKFFDKKVLDAQQFLFEICLNHKKEKYDEMIENEIISTREYGISGIMPKKVLGEIYTMQKIKKK